MRRWPAALAAWFAGFEETGLLIGYWAGTLAGAGLCDRGARLLRLARPSPPGVSPGRLGSILREGAVATLNDLVSGLFARLDLYLVGLFLGESAGGHLQHGAPDPDADPPGPPELRRAAHSDRGQDARRARPGETGVALASAARLILAIQLPILVMLAAIGLPLLDWLGPEFALGYLAMLLLAVAETIQGAFGVCDLIFLYRRPTTVLRITLATILVNLAVGVLLIGPLGIDGAAFATLAAYAAGAIVRRHLLQSRFGLRIPLHYSVGPVIATAFALLAAVATEHFLVWAPVLTVTGVALAAALLVYAAALKLWLILAGKSLALVKFQTD